MRIEVVGCEGVVGNATYQWLKTMHPEHEVVGRDKNDGKSPQESAMAFICVPEAFAEAACLEVATCTSLIVVRSTVSPGTCKRLQIMLDKHICHNPEFLREATALQDVFSPNYILIGACCREHGEIVKRLYEPARVGIVVTDTTTSELAKIITNNYLACLISFWNEAEAIAQASGVSGHHIGAITMLDPRVVGYGAKYHHKFGGKCLPKEIEQMLLYAKEKRVPTPMLEAIKKVNEW